MKLRLVLASVILVVAVIIVGCLPSLNKDTVKTVSLTDYKGNVVQVSTKPQRIVSLTLGTDEILMDLVATERIAALTRFSDDAGISHITDRSSKIENKLQSNTVEEILALKPDLVLIADWWGLEILATLRDMNIPVYVYKTPYTLAEVRDSVREVAKVVGEEEKGEKVIQRFDAKLAQLKRQVDLIPQQAKKRVVALSAHGAFGGKGSLYDDMCKYSGVINCLADMEMQGTQTLSKEEIIRLNPDTFLITNWHTSGMQESQTKLELLNDPSLQTVKAIQQKAIIEVSGQCIYCTSQYVADSCGLLASGAYPEFVQFERK